MSCTRQPNISDSVALGAAQTAEYFLSTRHRGKATLLPRIRKVTAYDDWRCGNVGGKAFRSLYWQHAELARPNTRITMPQVVLRTFSYRFAEQVLNANLAIRQEIESILRDPTLDIATCSRPNFNSQLETRFVAKGWQAQPLVIGEPGEPLAKMDFLKARVGIEVEFGHASFLGIDLLKMQIGSYSGLDKIDIGVYIVTTAAFQQRMATEFSQNWDGSLKFEKVVRYLPYFKSAIQIPIFVYGIDVV